MRSLKVVDVDTGDIVAFWCEDEVANILCYFLDQDLEDWLCRKEDGE